MSGVRRREKEKNGPPLARMGYMGAYYSIQKFHGCKVEGEKLTPVFEKDCTILLVEDSEDDVFTFKRALKKAGIANPLQHAADGQAAIDALTASGDVSELQITSVPCVIFLDLKLPYRNGFQVLEWLRAQPRLKNLRVVTLTGSDEPSDRQRATSLGVHAYMVKPAAAPEILTVLGSL